jgi:hypothetical protein
MSGPVLAPPGRKMGPLVDPGGEFSEVRLHQWVVIFALALVVIFLGEWILGNGRGPLHSVLELSPPPSIGTLECGSGLDE